MGKHHLEIPLLTVNFIVFVIFYVFNEAELSDSQLPLELLATFTSWSGPQSIQLCQIAEASPAPRAVPVVLRPWPLYQFSPGGRLVLSSLPWGIIA